MVPGASPTVVWDPARQPGSVGQAQKLIRKVIAGPELFGRGVVRATPYEGDPSRWAVLGQDCGWRLEPLPNDVLATLTRYFEVPAEGGKGSVRLSATVSVHRTALGADWAQAGTLEEVMGCPEQTLRPGERLTGLMSASHVWGDGANRSGEDQLHESGQCRSRTRGGPYPYVWLQSTFGPVTVGASACGGRGRSDEEVQRMVTQSSGWMRSALEDEIGRPAGAPSRSSEPGAWSGESSSASGTQGGA
ncbi:hypothetical protein SUDANB105_08041 [Streptomyces sp. enrichment culture]|uniref:hypothetical protein n=1 Tax=Streptomyces sp. enrichment culture TaxID=1795815 RepID=UPI003F5596F5